MLLPKVTMKIIGTYYNSGDIMKKRIMVLGGDKRNLYLTNYLNTTDFSALWYAAELCDEENDYIVKKNYEEDIDEYDAVVLPLPLSRDGEYLNCPFCARKLPVSQVADKISGKICFTSDSLIDGINYFDDKCVVIDNARLTAVGFLMELLKAEKGDIMEKSALVTGFGNVSKAVCEILKNNKVKVTVAARKSEQRHEAKGLGYGAADFSACEKIFDSFDYIINTVPFELFDAETVTKANKNCIFFELAYGLPKDACQRFFAYINCKGMPGKHTPKSAGKVIADFIKEKMRE